MKTLTRLIAIALVCCGTTTGCGGSAKGEGSAARVAEERLAGMTPPVDQSPVGIWDHGPDVVIDGVSYFIDCVVAETLELNCRLGPSSGGFLAAIRATLQVVGSQVTGTGTFYAKPGTTLPDGSTVADLTISDGTVSDGTVNPGVSLRLVIDAAGVSFSATFVYNAELHDRGSALATVAGNYPNFDIYGDPTSFSVNASGVITSQSSSGCVGNGQINIIEANFNVYDVTLDLTSCGALDGSYDGLGITSFQNENDPAANDVFAFDVFTSQSVIDGVAFK